MFIRCRPACLQDLPECLTKIRDDAQHDDASRRALLALWRSLLSEGAANFALIEDMDAPPGERIIWFSFKVFLTDPFLHLLRTLPNPCVSRQVLADWQGKQAALLTLPELRRSNSREGVNILTLNFGMPHDWRSGEKRDWVASKSVEWSWYSTGGYQIKSYFLEVYGEYEWAWAQGFGMSRQNSYQQGDSSRDLANGPCLYGIERGDDAHSTGTPMSVLLRRRQPCFEFRPPEQEMLLWAMMDITDDELGAQLALATVTIKKRWQSIYGRVAEADPALLGSAAEDTKRGTEKKRRLLAYLRHHMEELRPHLPLDE